MEISKDFAGVAAAAQTIGLIYLDYFQNFVF